MKQVKIINLQLKNFKGIASGTFAFNGANTEIVADVMQGKSTIKTHIFGAWDWKSTTSILAIKTTNLLPAWKRELNYFSTMTELSTL